MTFTRRSLLQATAAATLPAGMHARAQVPDLSDAINVLQVVDRIAGLYSGIKA